MMMRKFLALVVVLAIPATVAPAAVHHSHAKSLRARYTVLYRTVAHQHGARTPGRNIARFGLRFKWVSKDGARHHWFARRAKPKELGRSIRTFERWLAPPPVAAMPSDGVATAQPAYAGGNYSIPRYIVMCESGGNYRARNPSGAGGAYQIMPGTWHAYGGSGSDPASASPAEQDRVASRIYQAQGASPWTCG